jgi:hypothetical protein
MSVFIGGGDAVSREGLEIPTHDYISNTYDGSGNLTTVAVLPWRIRRQAGCNAYLDL